MTFSSPKFVAFLNEIEKLLRDQHFCILFRFTSTAMSFGLGQDQDDSKLVLKLAFTRCRQVASFIYVYYE